MYSLAGPQHPQHRDRGRVRRLPGHRQGGQRRRRVQGALRDRHGQLDQLGARRRAGRLLLQGLFRGRRDATASRSTSRCRRATSATSCAGHVARADGPADPPADPRHQRERRARRVLPHRPLPAARGGARRTRRRARRWTSRRRRTSSASSSTSSAAIRAIVRELWDAARARRRLRSRRHAALGARRGVGLRLRAQHACRSHRDDPRRRTRATASSSTRTPPTASRSGASTASPRVPLVCLETALPAKFAATIREALGREPERPAAYADLEARPQRFDVLPADAARVKAYIAAHAEPPRDAAPSTRAHAHSTAMRISCATSGAISPPGCGSRCSCRCRGSRSASTSCSCCCCSSCRRCIDVGGDWVRYGPDARFSWFGAGSEFFGAGVLLLTAALLALAFRQRALALAIPVLVLAAFPVDPDRAHAAGACRRCGRRCEARRRRVRYRDDRLGGSRCSCASSRSRSRRRGRIAGCARSRAGSLLAAPIWFAPMLDAERRVVARSRRADGRRPAIRIRRRSRCWPRSRRCSTTRCRRSTTSVPA